MDFGVLALALVPLFVVVDPLASIGLYLGLTASHTKAQRDRIAIKASVFAAIVLLAFAFTGKALLDYMGIELYSLKIAGGLLLALIGLNMLKEGEEIPQKEIRVATGGSHPAEAVTHDPSLVPLGLPMLAGPGAISLIIVQSTSFAIGLIAAAIAITMLATLVILLLTARAHHIIGDNGRRVITRIMGLLTVAFAVQYVLDGVQGWLGG